MSIINDPKHRNHFSLIHAIGKNGKEGPCHGDSGGPLTSPMIDSGVTSMDIIGITSSQHIPSIRDVKKAMKISKSVILDHQFHSFICCLHYYLYTVTVSLKMWLINH
jgi:hypothetical protein